MPEIVHLDYSDLWTRACSIASALPPNSLLYGVPNGGVYAALMVAGCRQDLRVTQHLHHAHAVVDDIVDSGATRDRYADRCFLALVDKTSGDADWKGKWVVFPWEEQRREDGPEDAVRRLLQYIGEDPAREGLRETPARVVKSYSELFAGYRQDPASLCKVFEDGACDEMVLLKDVSFVSFCEHHMLPFSGTAAVAYVPDKKVIGVSKLARLVDVYARRLQIQEKLTQQVTQALMTHLQPKGAACVIEAAHSCMSCRGVNKQQSVMVTSSLLGAFRDDPKTRAEFFSMVNK